VRRRRRRASNGALDDEVREAVSLAFTHDDCGARHRLQDGDDPRYLKISSCAKHYAAYSLVSARAQCQIA
jgi:hypothetical protein